MPAIDERYAFLAVEDKHALVSALLAFALSLRPNIKDFPVERYKSVYGYDILTLALLSDSPLTSPLTRNFEGVLTGCWRFVNRIWALKNKYTKDIILTPLSPEILNNNYHKWISQLHTEAKILEHDFSQQGFSNLLASLSQIAPNLVEEIINS